MAGATFKYHKDYHHEEVEISEDVTKAEKVLIRHGNGVVYTERPVKGHVVFQVEVLSVNNNERKWNIGIGIMIQKSDTPLKKSEIPEYTIYAPDHCMWHDNTVYNNMMGMTKWTEKKYGKMHLINVRKGDRLGVLITSSGELQFLLNGKPQGIAARNIYRPGFDVYLAVDHYPPFTATRILSNEEIKAQAHLALEKAMDEGHVSLENIKMVICGPPCVGKTAFKALLLNNPRPLKHHSTPIATRPVQAIERIAAGEKVWVEVTEEDLLLMLCDTIEKQTKKETSYSLEEPDGDATTPLHCASQTNTKSSTSISASSLPTAQASTSSPKAQASTPLHVQTPTPQVPKVIDNASKKILDKLSSTKERKGSQNLLEATWIHLLDSGGQPQFIDLLRMFVRNNSLYILAMNVTESLHDKPTFIYSINGEAISTPKELTMTNLQIIENFVHSITSVSKGNGKPAFVIVSTHCDKSKFRRFIGLDETLKAKNQLLQECLHDFLDLFIFYNRKSHELIFPVDNLCLINRAKISSELRTRLLSSRPDIIFNIKIPVRWYVFDLNVKEEASKEAHGMISLESCYAIGNKFSMSTTEVDHCLIYLDSMRLCIYYPIILPHVIFTSPQFLIESLSNVVRVSFVDDIQQLLPEGVTLSDDTILSLKRDGVFGESLLDNLGLTFIPNLFTKSDFLSLLQLSRLVSPIKAAHNAPQYFIPTLLPAEHLTKKQKKTFSTIADPLLITFNKKLVLQGLFPALIVSLLSRKEEPCFFIDSRSPVFPRQLRHAVKLYSEDLFGSVFFCDDYKLIEVYFTGRPQHCRLLRKVILEALSASAEVLGYDEKTLNISALVHCHRQHIIATNNKEPHSITISYKRDTPEVGCSIETGLYTITVNDISDKQSCWLIGPTNADSESNSLPSNGTALLCHYHAPIILEAIKTIVFQWQSLGIHLGIEKYKLDEIKYNCHDQIQVCRKEMVYYWIEAKIATCDKLISALSKVGEMKIVDDIKHLQTI